MSKQEASVVVLTDRWLGVRICSYGISSRAACADIAAAAGAHAGAGQGIG